MKDKIIKALSTLVGIIAVFGLLYLGMNWQKRKTQNFPGKVLFIG